MVPVARSSASVSFILPPPPGTGAGLESGRAFVCTHSSWAASPLRFSLASTAAASVANRPTATTITAPRGGRLTIRDERLRVLSAMAGQYANSTGATELRGSYPFPDEDDLASRRTIAYREAGEGPVLLLIHGMAGTSEAGAR